MQVQIYFKLSGNVTPDQLEAGNMALKRLARR